MSDSATSQVDATETVVVSTETEAIEEEAGPQAAGGSGGRISGAVRELKSLLALSKEAKFDVNLPKKRKSEHRRKSNESPSKSNMPKKEHRLTRFPVTAESELEIEFPITADMMPTEESPSKSFKKKKSSASSDSPNISGSQDEKRKERRSLSSGLLVDVPVFKPNKDIFCWRCHREGVNIACETCPRSYHSRCLKQTIEDPEHWPCPECVTILKAESTQSRSPAMRGMTLEHLCSLLKFAVLRMKQVGGSSPFSQPVDTKYFPEYEKYIIQPMDLSRLEKNIKENLYGSTHAFEADAKWVLHNSIVFNSYQSKLTSVAKTIMKICKQEMAEIENCPTCYLNANTKKNTWFVEVCPKPHLLVWAKLKGFPFWPGKVMSCRDGNVDVRFFGAHDRAWVPEKECFLYMPRDPNGFRSKRNDIEKCIAELEVHVENLRQVFGQFCYPDCKIPIDPSEELKQLQIFLPQYKSYVNRTKRHKLFHYVGKIDSGKEEGTSVAEELSKTEAEEKKSEEEKTDQDPSIEDSKESTSKDEELMEGYGTDDESMPLLIDMKTRKKLLDKSMDEGYNDGKEGSSKLPERREDKGILKGISKVSNVYKTPEVLEKDEDNDPKLLSDSSRLCEKISTVDVLEDMEINLGNDEGIPCVNISRKNSFDSTDYSKSDTDSTTSSRKGPVKMDVENFEVILTSPTKLKIVDKLMKRLSDGNTEEKKEEVLKHKVVGRVSVGEDENGFEENRDEMSPEPKQLEEPPMDYSETESEIVEKSDKMECEVISHLEDSQKQSKISEDVASEEKPGSSSQAEPEKSVEVDDNLENKPKEKKEDYESLKIKIKLSEVKNGFEKSEKKSPKKIVDKVEVSDSKIEIKSVVQDAQEFIEKHLETSTTKKDNERKEVDKKNISKESTLELVSVEETDSVIKVNDQQISSCDKEWAWQVVAGELITSNEKIEENNRNEIVESSQVDATETKDESIGEKLSEVQENIKESLDILKEDVDQEEKGKNMTEIVAEGNAKKKQRVEISDFPQSPEIEQMEEMEDEDDDIPLSQIQTLEKIDKENILKVIHSDLNVTREEDTESSPTIVPETEPQDLPVTSTSANDSLPPPQLEKASSSPSKNKNSESELSSSEKLSEKSEIKKINLSRNILELAKSKNVELYSEPESTKSSELHDSSDNMSNLKISSESSDDDSHMPDLPEEKICQSRKRKLSVEVEDTHKKVRADDKDTSEDEAMNQDAAEEKMDKLSEDKLKDCDKLINDINDKMKQAENEGQVFDKQKRIADIEKAIADIEKQIADAENENTDKVKPTEDKKSSDESIKEKDANEDTCDENVEKSSEKEQKNCKLPQISLENLQMPASKKPSRQPKSKLLDKFPRPMVETTSPHLDEMEIKSEPDSDLEYMSDSVGENLEAKKRYLSALNILERDSEALQAQKDKPSEIRTRSKTEEKRGRFRIVDNLTKIIDDVAVNYGVKKGSSPHVSLTRLQRRSLDEQSTKPATSTSSQNKSENGEIFVKSFAKIVSAKPRARKSFPQSFDTEARQIQQIKMARREESHPPVPALTVIRKETPESKTTTSTMPTISKTTKDSSSSNSNISNSNAQQSSGSPMAVLQQLENMTSNKSYIIVTSQNQDVVLLPPNKPINYNNNQPQTVMSVAPVVISSAYSQPAYITSLSCNPALWRPKISEKVLANVNLTNSQNYIPFKEPERIFRQAKQVSLLMANNSAASSSGALSTITVTSASSKNSEQCATATSQVFPATVDEEMPLQSGSVTSNAKDGASGSNITNTNGIDSSTQEDSTSPSQSGDTSTRENNGENIEDDEFRLINNLIPGSVAKVVHEIVQRPPPKLKPRPPGMLSTVFSEGIPSSAGTVTSKINSVAHRLSDYLRGMLIETLDDLGKSGNNEATVTGLKLEIEALKHKHNIELSEIEKNMCTVLKDIQRSIVEDRERIIEETRAACEAETIKRIEEAKSKQWCANCLKEAQFYCCWNTSYCDYPCQQKHWPQHMTKCTQSQNSNTATGGAQSSSVASSTAVPTVVRPLAGQQLILRPAGVKPGTLGRVFAKPVQKVYLNRNTTASKTLRVQSANGSFLTVMEAPPGQYQVVSSIPPNTVVRTSNAPPKKAATLTTSTSAKPIGQKVVPSGKIVSKAAPPAPALFEDESD